MDCLSEKGFLNWEMRVLAFLVLLACPWHLYGDDPSQSMVDLFRGQPLPLSMKGHLERVLPMKAYAAGKPAKDAAAAMTVPDGFTALSSLLSPS